MTGAIPRDTGAAVILRIARVHDVDSSVVQVIANVIETGGDIGLWTGCKSPWLGGWNFRGDASRFRLPDTQSAVQDRSSLAQSHCIECEIHASRLGVPVTGHIQHDAGIAGYPEFAKGLGQ